MRVLLVPKELSVGALAGLSGTAASTKATSGEVAEPTAFEARSWNRNVFDVSAAVKLLTSYVLRVGLLLTYAASISTGAAPVAPAALRMEYDVISQPPSLAGTTHLSFIV